jgi:hypothetical protein
MLMPACRGTTFACPPISHATPRVAASQIRAAAPPLAAFAISLRRQFFRSGHFAIVRQAIFAITLSSPPPRYSFDTAALIFLDILQRFLFRDSFRQAEGTLAAAMLMLPPQPPPHTALRRHFAIASAAQVSSAAIRFLQPPCRTPPPEGFSRFSFSRRYAFRLIFARLPAIHVFMFLSRDDFSAAAIPTLFSRRHFRRAPPDCLAIAERCQMLLRHASRVTPFRRCHAGFRAAEVSRQPFSAATRCRIFGHY